MSGKKVFLIFSLIFLAGISLVFAEDIRYVTSPDGLRVRSEPNLSSKVINTLYYGEYVIVDKIGKEDTIDGIKANWVRAIFFDDEEAPEKNGWLFGGYLSKDEPELGNDAFEFINSYLKKSRKKEFLAPYFPEEYRTVYFQNDLNWENQHPDYECTLENLCQKEYFPDKEAVTIRECMFFEPPQASRKYGAIRILPAGTKLELYNYGAFGVKGGVLFPIYEFRCEDPSGTGYTLSGYIRGLDITSSEYVNSVSDGKGGKYTLYYQRALKSINSDIYGHSKEEITEALDNYMSIEVAYLRGGFKITCAIIKNPNGKRYDITKSLSEHSEMRGAHTLSLEYPLVMSNPVLFLKEEFFGGGMGGGYSLFRFSTVDLRNEKSNLRNAFEYGYLSADAGYDGMAYHYFTKNTAVTYEFQTDEMGNVEDNSQGVYLQKPGSPYVFEGSGKRYGEPQGKSQTFKIGQYVNPICRLKMRMSPELSSRTLFVIKPGTLFKVVDVGDIETIDGIKANWVRIEPVNDDTSVEGYVIKDSFPALSTSAWVFGAYLE